MKKPRPFPAGPLVASYAPRSARTTSGQPANGDAGGSRDDPSDHAHASYITRCLRHVKAGGVEGSVCESRILHTRSP